MRPRLRSPSAIIGIILMVIGLAISVSSISSALGLMAAQPSDAATAPVLKGFHSTALLPGIFPVNNPVAARINQLFHIGLYSEVVVVVGLALIVDAFLGNPFSRVESLLVRRAKIAISLGKVKSEKAKLASLNQRSMAGEQMQGQGSMNVKLKNLRSMELSLEKDLRALDWDIREAGETDLKQSAQTTRGKETTGERGSRYPAMQRPLRSSAGQGLDLILDDVVMIAREEKRDRESLRILLENCANRVGTLAHAGTTKKELGDLENIRNAIVRLAGGYRIDARILEKLPENVRRKIEEARDYLKI